MEFHGNDKRNPNPHHLYAIHDEEEEDVFKFGISDAPIGEDGQSSRMREQINFLNKAVGWLRFVAEVLLFNIEGRERALEEEQKAVEEYFRKHGHYPRGNQ